jgi:hypothetical protein
MAHSHPLPSTRDLLTSLISTIASSTKQQDQSEGISNPLSSTTAASQNTKSAFLTLHSLFPHDFLPALDLLDRGLVTRFVLSGEPEPEGVATEIKDGEQLDEDRAGDENDASESENNERRLRTEATQDENAISNQNRTEPQAKKRGRGQTIAYQVRSAQRTKSSSSSRSEYSTSTITTGTSHEVRLKAWNCSCPAFAFAALPVDATENSSGNDGIGGDEDDAAGYGLNRDQYAATTAGTAAYGGENEIAWLGFGGLTRGQDVPVCKHLLACVVAERCQGFEQLVEEKEAGVEEVAGWAAGWGD